MPLRLHSDENEILHSRVDRPPNALNLLPDCLKVFSSSEIGGIQTS
jgi:hypothetical protein